jgi:hypothetical protein
MILLPLFLIWPLAWLCQGQPSWFVASQALLFVVFYLWWCRLCIRRARSWR